MRPSIATPRNLKNLDLPPSVVRNRTEWRAQCLTGNTDRCALQHRHGARRTLLRIKVCMRGVALTNLNGGTYWTMSAENGQRRLAAGYEEDDVNKAMRVVA